MNAMYHIIYKKQFNSSLSTTIISIVSTIIFHKSQNCARLATFQFDNVCPRVCLTVELMPRKTAYKPS